MLRSANAADQEQALETLERWFLVHRRLLLDGFD